MFHVKHRRLPLLFSLLTFGVLAVACSKAAEPRGWAAPVKTDQLVFVSSAKGRLDAIDASSKQRLWRFPGEIKCQDCGTLSWEINGKGAGSLRGIYGDPVLGKNGTIYFGDYNGYVYAIRPADVKSGLKDSQRPRAATFKLDDPIIGGLALDDASGQLFVTSGKSLYKLQTSQLDARFDNKDSKIEFASVLTTGGEIWGAPVVSGGKVYVASLDGIIYALDPTTGKEAWRYDSGRAMVSTPLVQNGVVLVGGFDNRLHALDAATGEQKWAFATASWVWSHPTVSSGKAYLGDFDGAVYAVNLSDGSKAWSLNLGHGAIRSAPAVTSDTVIVATEEGWLIGLGLDGSKVWERKVGTAVNADLVVSGDTVFIAPQGCVTPEGGQTKEYYISVDPRSGDLSAADGVC